MEGETRGSGSSAYLFIVSLEQFNNTLHWPSCTPSGPRTPGPPGTPSNLTQSQTSKLREYFMALETFSNIFLLLRSQDQHSLNIMGCWICAQLCLFRPADRKFNIAKVWPKPTVGIRCPASWIQTSAPFLNTMNQALFCSVSHSPASHYPPSFH